MRSGTHSPVGCSYFPVCGVSSVSERDMITVDVRRWRVWVMWHNGLSVLGMEPKAYGEV